MQSCSNENPNQSWWHSISLNASFAGIPWGPSWQSSALQSRMPEQYDRERSWHTLILHMHVERSSLVEKSGSTRVVGELESVKVFILAIILPSHHSKFPFHLPAQNSRERVKPSGAVTSIVIARQVLAHSLLCNALHVLASTDSNIRGLNWKTHSRQLDSTVSALGRGTGFLDVKVTKLSARGLDNADLVWFCVVSSPEWVSLPCAWWGDSTYGLRRLYVNLLDPILSVFELIDWLPSL
jgi:hypothetical protein